MTSGESSWALIESTSDQHRWRSGRLPDRRHGAVLLLVHGMAGRSVRAIDAARQGKSYLCPDVTSGVVEASQRGTYHSDRIQGVAAFLEGEGDSPAAGRGA